MKGGVIEYWVNKSNQMVMSERQVEMVENGIRDGSIPFKRKKTAEQIAAEQSLASSVPKPLEHIDMVLVDDPTGEMIVGFGRFERGSWVDTLLAGHWPDGSVWRGERGSKADTLYQIRGSKVVEIANYSRHGRITQGDGIGGAFPVQEPDDRPENKVLG